MEKRINLRLEPACERAVEGKLEEKARIRFIDIARELESVYTA